MWAGLDRFSRLLVDASFATTIFLSLVVLLMLLCHQPARRIVVAQSAILLSILMMALVATSPLPRFNPIAWFLSHNLTPQPAQNLPDWDGRAGRFSRVPNGPAWLPSSANQRDAEAAWSQSWLLRSFALVYLFGVALGLAWMALGFWAIRRVVNQSLDASSRTKELYLSLIHEFRPGSPRPGLRVSATLNRPVLTGLGRGLILIPARLDEPDADVQSLRLILLHELAHAGQGDAQINATSSLAQCLWFFIPYAWWLRSQLRIDQEFLADQKTVAMVGSSAGYATRLVALAANEEHAPSLLPIADSVPLLSGWWWEGGLSTPLLQRVVMLLHAPFPIETSASRLWSSAVPTLALITAVLVSSLTVFDGPAAATAGNTVPASTRGPGLFQVTKFVASPQVLSPSGRSPAYVLPLPLPGDFELSLEVEASHTTLAQMSLAGYSLASVSQDHIDPLPAQQDPASSSHPSPWYRVRLRRAKGQVSLFVNDRPISAIPVREGSSGWLTIEPAPDQTAIIHHLAVTW